MDVRVINKKFDFYFVECNLILSSLRILHSIEIYRVKHIEYYRAIELKLLIISKNVSVFEKAVILDHPIFYRCRR